MSLASLRERMRPALRASLDRWVRALSLIKRGSVNFAAPHVHRGSLGWEADPPGAAAPGPREIVQGSAVSGGIPPAVNTPRARAGRGTGLMVWEKDRSQPFRRS